MAINTINLYVNPLDFTSGWSVSEQPCPFRDILHLLTVLAQKYLFHFQADNKFYSKPYMDFVQKTTHEPQYIVNENNIQTRIKYFIIVVFFYNHMMLDILLLSIILLHKLFLYVLMVHLLILQ